MGLNSKEVSSRTEVSTRVPHLVRGRVGICLELTPSIAETRGPCSGCLSPPPIFVVLQTFFSSGPRSPCVAFIACCWMYPLFSVAAREAFRTVPFARVPVGFTGCGLEPLQGALEAAVARFVRHGSFFFFSLSFSSLTKRSIGSVEVCDESNFPPESSTSGKDEVKSLFCVNPDFSSEIPLKILP